MKHSRLTMPCFLLSAFCFLLLAGCQLPQWRVFQKTIDPKLAEKPASQIEAERAGAAFIRDKSAIVEPDPAQQISQIHQVATPLSQSLGAPKTKPSVEDSGAVISELRAGLLASQKRADEWKAFAKKYAGTELEGTGFNLAGPSALLGLAGVVALCIFVPGFLTFLLFVIRRMRTGFQQMAQAVEEYQIEHPKDAAELKEYLSSAMDKTSKTLIKREKKYLDEENLKELRIKVASAANA